MRKTMKLSEVIQETIDLARAIQWPETEPFFTQEDDSRPADDGGADPSWVQPLERLRAYLRSQPPAVIYAVVAIMYLGRDSYDEDRWDFLEWYTRASDVCHTPAAAVETLLAKVPLADYLEWGMQEAAAGGMNVDRLLGT